MYCIECKKVVPCKHMPNPAEWNGFEEVKE